MRTAIVLIMTIGMAVLGLVAGWFVGNLMEITGILDPETFWKTDPENVWACSAIVDGVLGAVVGAIIARRLFSWT